VSVSHRRPITVEQFNELARVAVGLPVSHTWRGYGSAIFAEFGRLRLPERLPRASKVRLRQPRGEVGIMIEWSWRVERARSIAFGSWSTEARITAGVAALAGAHISAIGVEGRLPELVLGLSDGRWVRSFMTSDGQPRWAVFLPDGSWLTVERGRIVHDIQNRRRLRTSSSRPSA
jgi:hypothetical protein